MRCLQHTLQRRLPLLPFRAQLLNGVTSGVALSVLPAGVAVVYDRAVTTPILADRYLHHHTCSAALAQCCVQSFRTVDVRRRSSARHTAAACLRHTEHQLRWPNAWRQRRTQVHQRHGTQLFDGVAVQLGRGGSTRGLEMQAHIAAHTAAVAVAR